MTTRRHGPAAGGHAHRGRHGRAFLVQEFLHEADPQIKTLWYRTFGEAASHLADSPAVSSSISTCLTVRARRTPSLCDSRRGPQWSSSPGCPTGPEASEPSRQGHRTTSSRARSTGRCWPGPPLRPRAKTRRRPARPLRSRAPRRGEPPAWNADCCPRRPGRAPRFVARYRPGRGRLCSAVTSTTSSAPPTARPRHDRRRLRPRPGRGRPRRELRIAWRALVLAGPPDEVLATLDRCLDHERAEDGVFATLCDLTSRRTAEPRSCASPAIRARCCSGRRASQLETSIAARPRARARRPLAGRAHRAATGVDADALHRRPDRGPRAGFDGAARHRGAARLVRPRPSPTCTTWPKG